MLREYGVRQKYRSEAGEDGLRRSAQEVSLPDDTGAWELFNRGLILKLGNQACGLRNFIWETVLGERKQSTVCFAEED